LTFKKANNEWGISFKGFSNGVSYADLDNDGDLEIITNNIDDKASIFENRSSENNNYISITFEGTSKNKFGLGNRVYVTVEEQTQMQELTLTRGFQSSVAPQLHFGLKKAKSIEKLKIVWADGKEQIIKNQPVNKKLIVKYTDATVVNKVKKEKSELLFITDKSSFFPEHKHQENNYNDFKDQVLLPHKMSKFGPALAIGDLNNDGLEDYYIGGAHGYSGSIYFQEKTGFVKQNVLPLEADKLSEDIGALIFDADQDGDNDLYVVSGGYEFRINSTMLQDRLYINNGDGNFTKSNSALPKMLTSGSRVICFRTSNPRELSSSNKQLFIKKYK